jgi:hypothetical protein
MTQPMQNLNDSSSHNYCCVWDYFGECGRYQKRWHGAPRKDRGEEGGP